MKHAEGEVLRSSKSPGAARKDHLASDQKLQLPGRLVQCTHPKYCQENIFYDG